MSKSAVAIAGSRDFLLRRLHSLTGLVPIGAFLVMHLIVNSLIAFSSSRVDYYQQAVDRIHSLGPFLVSVEILFIFLPIAFHGILGLKIWRESRPNVSHYPYWCNFRYTLQRITGVIVFAFILTHLWHVHWLGQYIPGHFGALFAPDRATATTAYALQHQRWWTIPVYAIGIMCACYHFATGLWTFMITWGITVGEKAQDRMGYICAAVGVVFGFIGLTAQVAALRYPHPAPTRMSNDEARTSKEAPNPKHERQDTAPPPVSTLSTSSLGLPSTLGISSLVIQYSAIIQLTGSVWPNSDES